MEKVSLSSAEFLSVYTGVPLADSFDIVNEAEEKIFGFSPYTLTAAECAKQFRNYNGNNNFEFAQKVKELGKFKHQEGNDVMQEIADYCNRFEMLIGSKEVLVDKMKYKEDIVEF